MYIYGKKVDYSNGRLIGLTDEVFYDTFIGV